MSAGLVPYAGGALTRDARRTGRQIQRAQSVGQLRQAVIDVETDIAIARVEAVTAATGQAMGSVARVAQAELALVQQFPQASGRVAFIAERHMLALGDIVDGLCRQVRRS